MTIFSAIAFVQNFEFIVKRTSLFVLAIIDFQVNNSLYENLIEACQSLKTLPPGWGGAIENSHVFRAIARTALMNESRLFERDLS
jgi:hypothetical protein